MTDTQRDSLEEPVYRDIPTGEEGGWPWGWTFILIGVVVLLFIAVYVWPGFMRSNPQNPQSNVVAEAPIPAEQVAPVEQPRAEPAPAPRTVRVVTDGEPLPDAPAEVEVDENVRKLIDLMKARNPPRDRGAIMVNFRGRSGALYRVYYSGDATPAAARTLTIDDLPTDYKAHDPNEDVSRTALHLSDIGLDGSIDQGWNGGPYAVMDRAVQAYFQSEKVRDGAVVVGERHKARMQERFTAMIADILPPPPPAPAAAPAAAAPAAAPATR